MSQPDGGIAALGAPGLWGCRFLPRHSRSTDSQSSWFSSETLNPFPAIIQLGGDRKGKPNVPNAEEKSRLGDFSPAGTNHSGLCRSVSPGDGA